MQKFEFLRQPLLGELAMSPEERKKERKRKNAIYSGQLRLCQQPRAAHALRSDQLLSTGFIVHRHIHYSMQSYGLGLCKKRFGLCKL